MLCQIAMRSIGIGIGSRLVGSFFLEAMAVNSGTPISGVVSADTLQPYLMLGVCSNFRAHSLPCANAPTSSKFGHILMYTSVTHSSLMLGDRPMPYN